MNSQMVGMQGDKVVILFPKTSMTPDEAIEHAAWLVALAEAGASSGVEFEEILERVRNS